MYGFIQSNEDNFPCQTQCQVLDVSRSGYYAWKTGKSHQPKEEDKMMEQKIIHSFRENKRRYGSRRIVKELHSTGNRVSRYKAGKVLRDNGLKAIQPRSFVPKTTDSRHAYAISPNLLLDRIMPEQPDEVWVGDITYIPLAGGKWAYLAVWMDLYCIQPTKYTSQGFIVPRFDILSNQAFSFNCVYQFYCIPFCRYKTSCACRKPY